MQTTRSSRVEVFCEKSVLKNFTKLTEKHLCRVPGSKNVGTKNPVEAAIDLGDNNKEKKVI